MKKNHSKPLKYQWLLLEIIMKAYDIFQGHHLKCHNSILALHFDLRVKQQTKLLGKNLSRQAFYIKVLIYNLKIPRKIQVKPAVQTDNERAEIVLGSIYNSQLKSWQEAPKIKSDTEIFPTLSVLCSVTQHSWVPKAGDQGMCSSQPSSKYISVISLW